MQHLSKPRLPGVSPASSTWEALIQVSGQWLSFKKSNKFQNPFKEGKKKSERLRIYCQSSVPTSQRDAFPSLQKRRALTLCLTLGWGYMVQPSLVAKQEIVENVSPSGFASKSSNNECLACSFLRKHFRVFGGQMERDKERHARLKTWAHTLFLMQNLKKIGDMFAVPGDSRCPDKSFIEQYPHTTKTCTTLEALLFPPDT